MKITKKHIVIGIAVVILLFAIFSFFRNTQKSAEVVFVDQDLHDAIFSYGSLVDYSQRVAVWREMIKACPYWQAYASAELNSGRYKDEIKTGLTLDLFYTRLATAFVDENVNITEYYQRCVNPFQESDIDSFEDPCKGFSKYHIANILNSGLPTIWSWITKGSVC